MCRTLAKCVQCYLTCCLASYAHLFISSSFCSSLLLLHRDRLAEAEHASSEATSRSDSLRAELESLKARAEADSARAAEQIAQLQSKYEQEQQQVQSLEDEIAR